MISSPVPEAGRTAGSVQGVILLLVAVLPIMGSALIAPILPAMQEHFRDTPGVDLLVPLALTIPALCIALFSTAFGTLADRFGRRRLLLGACVVYAVCGIAPLVLGSLGLIVISRIGVGITEAVLMTCSTALIGDYFFGIGRAKWLASQTAVASIAATVFYALGGILGNSNWRYSFLLYAAGLLIFALVLAGTWEPVPSHETVDVELRFPWRRLAGILGVTLFGAFIFYIVPIQMAFMLNAIGTRAPATIGLATAVGSIAVVVGTLVYRRLTPAPPRTLTLISLVLAGLGLLGMAHCGDLRAMVGFAIINQLGCGLLLPTLLNWALDGLAFQQRGRGTGAFMTAFFLGQFISPIAVVIIAHSVGGLFASINLIAVVCIAFAAAFGARLALRVRVGVGPKSVVGRSAP
jgi:MFS family permease